MSEKKGHSLYAFTLTSLCGRRKESVAVVCVMTQQHRRKLTQQRRQNNNIAKVITHKPIQYNK